jgi:hypothetical protein
MCRFFVHLCYHVSQGKVIIEMLHFRIPGAFDITTQESLAAGFRNYCGILGHIFYLIIQVALFLLIIVGASRTYLVLTAYFR